MKLDVQLKYTEQYLPTPRHRKLRDREVQESVPLEITEVASKDAPVVFRTHGYKSYCDGIQPTDYRQFNGALYTPLRTCDVMAVHSIIEANTPFPTQGLGDLIRMYTVPYGLTRSREETLTDAAERAASFLLVDGVLWKKTGEPVYKACTFGLGNNHGGTSLMLANRYEVNEWDTDCLFNALQQEEAIQYAVEIARQRGDTESIPRIQARRSSIEVLDPSAVKLPSHPTPEKKLSLFNDRLAYAQTLSSTAKEEQTPQHENEALRTGTGKEPTTR